MEDDRAVVLGLDAGQRGLVQVVLDAGDGLGRLRETGGELVVADQQVGEVGAAAERLDRVRRPLDAADDVRRGDLAGEDFRARPEPGGNEASRSCHMACGADVADS
ncbi:hypothetical protein HPO96_06425 [Kribbella sandramycini]|uniref:Uncharacterized protein n=1 Tax=Kribbella sandramycini TaxID=60450 RepID=A0A7Y4NZ71_9ACTN|nr:hypothetical protein [Kribbella sandramycini]MBB6567521.1 hypothetical protein [Kribbella sandramycini]NOL39875.1 hypothetical protein [Kribbella sandramycini]